jgi:hypothetical protein
MSGGHFDHNQCHIHTIAESIQSYLDGGNEYGYCPEVLEKMEHAVKVLNEAFVYAHRIDWLLSDDDGEQTFLKLLEEDLNDRQI